MTIKNNKDNKDRHNYKGHMLIQYEALIKPWLDRKVGRC